MLRTPDIGKKYSILQIYIFMTMLISCIVFVEPSPYDVSMALFLSMILLTANITFNKTTIFPIILSLLFLLTNIISMFFVQTIFSSITYFIITCYVIGTFILLLALGQKPKEEVAYFILKGYYWAAIIATTIGILAYFNILPASDLFLMYGRVKSTFKDPNVFGPFLIIPALYALYLTESKGRRMSGRLLHLFMFILLVIGIVISFSRAAWGNLTISLFIYLISLKREIFSFRLRTFFSLAAVAIPILYFLIQLPIIEDLLSSRLAIKDYDSDRFGTQRKAIDQGLSNLLGMGPGQSDVVFQYSPHSLYARVFTENGLIGLLSILAIILLSIRRAFLNFSLSTHAGSYIYAIIFSSLVGLAFNSIFIDTLHWRHFWIVLALAWLPFTPSEEENI